MSNENTYDYESSNYYNEQNIEQSYYSNEYTNQYYGENNYYDQSGYDAASSTYYDEQNRQQSTYDYTDQQDQSSSVVNEQYTAEYYALDTEAYWVCLELAPEYYGESVALSDLDALCIAMRRPVRDENERSQLMNDLDPTNEMRISRTAFTTWLLQDIMAERQEQQSVVETKPRRDATPVWEEIAETSNPNDLNPSTPPYYYNIETGETKWALEPFITGLFRYLVELDQKRALIETEHASSIDMITDIRTLFVQYDEDRTERLECSEFHDLCIAIDVHVDTSDLTVLMQSIDPRYGTTHVTWDAFVNYWISNAPFQRRTRLASPFTLWECIESFLYRDQPMLYRHIETHCERWNAPNMEQKIVDLLVQVFPSTKLEWSQRIHMFYELQVKQKNEEIVSEWTLDQCRIVLNQLDHSCLRPAHLIATIRTINACYNDQPSQDDRLSESVVSKWFLDAIERVEMNGWKELTDSQGQVYYYHEIQGLTQWDSPHLSSQMTRMMNRFETSKQSIKENLQRMFHHYDVDESGTLGLEEFKSFYSTLLGHKESSERIQQVFDLLDTSGDGTISFEEFSLWWKTKMNVEEEEEDEETKRKRIQQEQRIQCLDYLKTHELIEMEQEYSFESNVLPRLVALLGKYPLKGLAYRNALNQLVYKNQMIQLDMFLEWYHEYEKKEKEKEEIEIAKTKAIALLQAQEREQKEKAYKLKMIRKGQLLTKTIQKDPKPIETESAESIWKRQVEMLFRKYDHTGTGSLDQMEIGMLTNALGHALTEQQLTQMMEIMDSSGDQRVSLQEFFTFWIPFQRQGKMKTMNKQKLLKDTTVTDVPQTVTDVPHRRQAISMLNTSASLAVSMELARDKAMKVTLGDVKEVMGEWKETIRERTTKQRNTIEEEEKIRLEQRRLREFIPTRNRRYAHLDVTWIEPDVVQCMIDMIQTIKLQHSRPQLPKPDAAQQIQRIMRGVLTRQHVLEMIKQRFHAYVDLKTHFYYYVDMTPRHQQPGTSGAAKALAAAPPTKARAKKIAAMAAICPPSIIWLERPVYRTIMSCIKPWEYTDCKGKIEQVQFTKKKKLMRQKKQFFEQYYEQIVLTTQSQRQFLVPSCFVIYDILESVRIRLLGSLWQTLRNCHHAHVTCGHDTKTLDLILVELMATRYRRQLQQRSNYDAGLPLPLHYVIEHFCDGTFPFRVIRAVYLGYPEAMLVTDAYGRTPLHLLFRSSSSRRITTASRDYVGVLPVLELILSKRRYLSTSNEHTEPISSSKSIWSIRTLSGETPLHIALRYQQPLETLRWLLKEFGEDMWKSAAICTSRIKRDMNKRRGVAVLHAVIGHLERNGLEQMNYWKSVILLLFRTWDPEALCMDRVATYTHEMALHLTISAFARVEASLKNQASRIGWADIEQVWVWLIHELVKHYPSALLVRRADDDLLPLHLALRSQIPSHVVHFLFVQTIEQLQCHSTANTKIQSADRDQSILGSLMLPVTNTSILHYALMHRSEEIVSRHNNQYDEQSNQEGNEALILEMLRVVPSTMCTIKTHTDHALPLHYAARHNASPLVFTQLCDLYPQACYERTKGSNELPLHLAIRANNVNNVRTLLQVAPNVLDDPKERKGMRALVLACSQKSPSTKVLLTLLEYTPSQRISANAKTRSHMITPMYALSLQRCVPDIYLNGVPEALETKFEGIDDEDAYFMAIARAKHRRQHHNPNHKWDFKTILELMDQHPVDEAVMQRALLAMNQKLQHMMKAEKESSQENEECQYHGILETITLNPDLLLVRRLHQTMFEFPWNPRIQLLGQAVLSKLLPTAYAKASYKARIDPYFNL